MSTPRDRRRRYLTTAVFTLVIAILFWLGWRMDRSQAEFRETVKERCQEVNGAFINYNTALRIRIETQVRNAPADQKEQVRRELEGLMFPIDDCSRYG